MCASAPPSMASGITAKSKQSFKGELLAETASGMVEGSILALSVTCGDSSPKGRALGKTKSFAVLPKPLPLGEVALRKQ